MPALALTFQVLRADAISLGNRLGDKTGMLKAGFLHELRRRNVLRAGVLYAGAVWALAQGISQLGPSIGLPDWATRWFLIAAIIGFPFWLAFAWFYEFTPQGLKRESEIDPGDSIAHSTGRKLDFWIIGVMAVAIVLLLTNTFVWRKGAGLQVTTAQTIATAVAKIPFKSIAVLPLANDSGDKDQQYFSDGLSEDFITALSQFAGLKVIGRNSAFQFRDSKDSAQTIGAKLGVVHLLEGSVRRQGDEVRISAELINTADASTLWSQHYDRPYKDLFALQDDITHAVAGALQAKLMESGGAVVQSDRPPSGNLTAYTAYLQGKFYDARNTEADERRAIAQYQAAIKDDPHYALAWAELSYAWTGMAGGFFGGQDAQQAYTKARAAANTALALNPNLAAAHGARGNVMFNADFDWTGAQAEYQRAVQLAPNDGASLFNLGNLLATLGHPDQAVALTRQALATDPLHAIWYNWLATYLSALGRFDEAKTAIRKAIELQPAAVGQHEQLAVIEIQRADAKAALAAAQTEPPGVWQDEALALASQIGANRAAAGAALKHLIDTQADIAPYQIAEVYALRRDPDQMFAWLERAWASRDPGIQLLLYDPFILRYEHDPRFAAFCRKVGLPTTTTAKAMP
ncbi:MAG: tetratricopeptide repeat protein [Rhodanobacteraceae bacterium]